MNDSSSYPDDFCENNSSSNSVWVSYWSTDQAEYGIFTAVVLLLYLVVGLPWNCLVAGVILKQRLYKQPTVLLLFALSLCDTLMLCTFVPLNIVTGFSGEFVLGNSDSTRCQACQIGLILTFFSLMSLFIVTLLSVDRFLFVYKAIYYERLMSPIKVTIILLVASCLLLFLSALPLFRVGVIGYFSLTVFCTLSLTRSAKHYVVIVVLVGMLLVVVFTIANVWVVVIVYRNVKVIYTERKSLFKRNQRMEHRTTIKKMMGKKRHKKQLNLMKVFGAILCSNFITWIPVLAVAFSSLFVDFRSIPHGIAVVIYLIFLSQIVIHPILESFIIMDVKKPLAKLFASVQMPCRTFRSEAKSKPTNNSEKKRESDELNPSCCRCGSLYILQAALLPDLKSSSDQT